MDELLRKIPSYELTQWKAYERAFGPLGNFYAADVWAGIHEQLQRIAALLTEGGKATVERLPRPMEVYKVALERQEIEEQAEEISDEESNRAAIAAMNMMFDAR